MPVTSEDKEDISGNPLPLVSHVRPMELSIELICLSHFYQSILKKSFLKQIISFRSINYLERLAFKFLTFIL